MLIESHTDDALAHPPYPPHTQTPPHPPTPTKQFAGAGSRNYRMSALQDHEKATYHQLALQSMAAARRYER